MKKKVKNIILFLLSILLLWYTFKGVKLSEVIGSLKEIKYIYVVISFLLGGIAYYVRAIRWKILIKSIGYDSKSVNSNISVAISYFSNLIFPRAGEIIRCSTMSKLENIPVNKLFGTVILERIIDVILLCLVILLAFIFGEESLNNFLKEVLKIREEGAHIDKKYYILILISILLFLLIIIIAIKNTFLYKKIIHFFIGVKAGVLSIKNIDKKMYFFVYTLVIWGCYFFMNFIVFFSFKETNNFGMSEGLVLLAVGGLSMLIPVQGGIGSYHLAVKIMLHFYGISEVTAISFPTLVHTTQTLLAIMFGGISFIYLGTVIKNLSLKTVNKDFIGRK